MNKIAIIYTTFLRDELMYKTIQSIVDNYTENCILLIGDQGRPTQKKDLFYSNISILNKVYQLPFDCGLSYSRNFLIKKAKELGFEFCLATADSLAFNQKYNFDPFIDFMLSDNKIAKIGFGIKNRLPWDFLMDLIPGQGFILNLSKEELTYNSMKFLRVDICKNFFLGRIDALLDIPWDENLKVAEHEDECWRLKQAGYKTYYNDSISSNYIDEKPAEYKIYRERMYGEFRKQLQQKYNISGWVKYGKGVKFKKCI